MIAKAKSEALQIVGDSDAKYNFGKAARLQEINPKHAALRAILSDPTLTETVKLVKKTQHEIFITHEFIPDTQERNGYLHFDRLHTFKIFFYLTDVTNECGPFEAVPGSHIKGKELRTSEWKRTTDYSKIKNRLAIDYPELGYTEESGTKILGPAGTLIVFDTDCFHKGGEVQPDHERIVLRTHNR